MIREILKNTDKKLAYLILFTAIIITIIQVLLKSNPTLPIIVASFCILYLIFEKEMIFNEITLKKGVINKLNNIIIIITFVSIFFYIMRFNYPYGSLFMVFLLISQFSVFISILQRENKWLILGKIILLSSLIRLSIFLPFPGMYGIDSLYHSDFINNIFLSGNVNPSYDYSGYPFYHILIVIQQNLSSLSERFSVFLIGIIQLTILSLIVYLIGKKISNETVGLISSLIYCCLASVLTGYFIPNMFGLSIFALLFYLVLNENKISYSIIFIICGISLVFVHPYPAINLIIILITMMAIKLITNKFFVLKKIINERKYFVRPGIVILLVILFCFNAFLLAYNYIINSFIINIFSKEKIADSTSIVTDFSIFTVINDLPTYLLISFGIIGLLIWLNPKNNFKKIYLGLTFLFMIIGFYAISVFNLSFIPLPYRLIPFIFLPLSIIAVNGIFYLSSIIKNVNIQFASLTLIFLLIAGLSINSANIYPDSSLYSGHSDFRRSLNNTEINGIYFLKTIQNKSVTYDSKNLSSNYDFVFYAYLDGTNQIDLFPQNRLKTKLYKNINQSNNVSIVRDYFLKNQRIRDYSFFPKINGEITLQKYQETEGISNWSLIYNNGCVWIFDE